MHDDPNVESALEFLHGHCRADLHFDGHVQPLKYVIAPDGRLAAPVMVAMLSAGDTTMYVPEDRDGALELMVTLQAFEESSKLGALADRWRIYHGEPPDVRWAVMTIDAARFGGMFIDGEALVEPNPFAAEEAAFCREINAHHPDALRRFADRCGGMRIEQPVLVGVDPRGCDVRAAYDVVRARFPAAAGSIGDARRMLLAE